MRLFFYLDNCIVIARTWEWVVFNTSRLFLHRSSLGFVIKWKKQYSSSTDNRVFGDSAQLLRPLGHSVGTQATGPPSESGEALGLVLERKRLSQAVLSTLIIQSIQAARAGSTNIFYRAMWPGFQSWCEEQSLDPVLYSQFHPSRGVPSSQE